MVTFDLISDSNNKAVYRYYPEGQKVGYGIIVLNKISGAVSLTKPADGDHDRTVSVEDQQSMRDAINEMRAAEGSELLTDDEFEIKSAFTLYTYATPASNKIVEAFNNGNLLRHGTVVWY